MTPQHEALREEFVRFLTVDSGRGDRRRRDYNQAIFLPDDDTYLSGHAVFTDTNLDMVLDKFDAAVYSVEAQP